MIDYSKRNPKLPLIIASDAKIVNKFGGRRFSIKECSPSIEIYVCGSAWQIDITTEGLTHGCSEDMVCAMVPKLSSDLDLAYKMMVELGLARTIAEGIYDLDRWNTA